MTAMKHTKNRAFVVFLVFLLSCGCLFTYLYQSAGAEDGMRKHVRRAIPYLAAARQAASLVLAGTANPAQVKSPTIFQLKTGISDGTPSNTTTQVTGGGSATAAVIPPPAPQHVRPRRRRMEALKLDAYPDPVKFTSKRRLQQFTPRLGLSRGGTATAAEILNILYVAVRNLLKGKRLFLDFPDIVLFHPVPHRQCIASIS